MKICAISDTHSFHRKVIVPDGDVLVHTGDITHVGELSILADFCAWLKTLPHRKKLVSFGNHDKFEREPNYSIATRMIADAGAIHLHDSEVVIDGIKFYGSAYTPIFYDWAWLLPRGNAIAKKWAAIPNDVDVLLTHGPPYGINDLTDPGAFGEHIGCQDLFERIHELKQLRAHFFGHCHGGYGITTEFGIKFVNSAICTETYRPTNLPNVIDI